VAFITFVFTPSGRRDVSLAIAGSLAGSADLAMVSALLGPGSAFATSVVPSSITGADASGAAIAAGGAVGLRAIVRVRLIGF